MKIAIQVLILRSWVQEYGTFLCHVTSVGDFSMETAYIQGLKSKAGSRVRIIGSIYDCDKLSTLRYYGAACFHDHNVSGTNPSLLEAIGWGKVVVAHDNRFNREDVGGVALYFSNSIDISDIVNEIEAYLSGQRQEIGLKAQQTIHGRYSWETIVDSYLKIRKNGGNDRNRGNVRAIVSDQEPGSIDPV